MAECQWETLFVLAEEGQARHAGEDVGVRGDWGSRVVAHMVVQLDEGVAAGVVQRGEQEHSRAGGEGRQHGEKNRQREDFVHGGFGDAVGDEGCGEGGSESQ